MHILLIDDHTLFREALLHVLRQLDATVVVFEAATIDDALQLITHSRSLDLILLDIDLPRLDGLTALPELRKLIPTVPIVVLSGSEAPEHLRQALDHGVAGYIPKSCSSHEMLAALHMILQGDIYIPPRLLSKLDINAFDRPVSPSSNEVLSPLTTRQVEVLVMMADGLPNKAIANKLHLAEGTVKLHVAAIMRALSARNRTEAVTLALKMGWISSNPHVKPN